MRLRRTSTRSWPVRSRSREDPTNWDDSLDNASVDDFSWMKNWGFPWRCPGCSCSWEWDPSWDPQSSIFSLEATVEIPGFCYQRVQWWELQVCLKVGYTGCTSKSNGLQSCSHWKGLSWRICSIFWKIMSHIQLVSPYIPIIKWWCPYIRIYSSWCFPIYFH